MNLVILFYKSGIAEVSLNLNKTKKNIQFKFEKITEANKIAQGYKYPLKSLN